MTEVSNPGRRRFIIAAATVSGGLALGLSGRFNSATADTGTTDAFAPWLVIEADNSVLIRVSTPEIGTGASTQLAMTVTEELHCDWHKVKIEFAALDLDERHDKVFSNSTPIFAYFSGRSTDTARNQALLRVGANARERLKLAAANTWNVDVADIDAHNSVLTHRPSGKTLTYGAVAASAAAITLDSEPALKPRSQWTFLGKASPAKLDIPAMVNGTARYGMDVRVPGMLYAALMQAPVQDGKLKSHGFDKIKQMPGVRGIAVIEDGDPIRLTDGLASQPAVFGDRRTSAVAVVADHYWQAKKALAALPLEWEDGDGARWKTTEQIVDAAIDLLNNDKGIIRLDKGDVASALSQATHTLEATYSTPFCDQSPMEPLNGTALITAERADLWHPTQITDQARAAVVEETGLDPDKVFVHQTLVGGAFGRRTSADDVRMVSAVARQFPGIPIHVIWSREESMRQGRYRALTAVKLNAALDADGMPSALVAHVSGRELDARPPMLDHPLHSSLIMGLADGPYAGTIIPNIQVTTHKLPVHIRSGAYRGPAYNSNCFFIESFIDECAHRVGMDPLSYRLKLFERWPDQGWTRCLQEATAQAGWGKPLPKGMAQGLALGNFGMFGSPEQGTTVCTVATVEVSQAGKLRVHALDVAFDCGSYMNADAVLAQIEGATIFGLNMALNEKLTVENGRIVEGNFDRYPMLRMGDMPKINIHFGATSGHERFAEIGEVATGTPGPAIANAIFSITGKRLRSTPILDHDLSWS